MNRIISALLATVCITVPALAQEPNTLTAEESAQGFQLLFDGKSINNWNDNWVTYKQNNTTNTDLAAGWTYNASLQAITSTTNTSDLRSKKTFKDFELRLEYRNDGNQGIFYRCLTTQVSPWQTGVEFAIDKLTSSSDIAAGAAYALYAPSPFTYKDRSTNAWNTVRIVCIGDSVEHWMNGFKVVGFKYHSADWWTRYTKSKWATGTAGAVAWTMSNIDPSKQKNSDFIREGYLGWQGNHGGRWELRSVRVNPNASWSTVAKEHPFFDGKTGIQALLQRSSVRQSFGRVSLPVGGLGARTASLIAVNGAIRPGEITSDGQALFSGMQPGAYFLDLGTASGNVVQKLYILP